MRVLLIHNPKAGDRKHSKKQLMASLTRCGHQAFYQSIKKRGWKKALKKPVFGKALGEGSFGVAKLRFGALIGFEWIASLELRPSTAVF